jgi:hypothetical protein
MKAAEVNLRDEFGIFTARSNYGVSREGFERYLRGKVEDPENLILQWCGNCGSPEHAAKTEVVDGINVCQRCLAYYRRCAICRTMTGNLTVVPDRRTGVCAGCLGANYLWCRDCNIYYPNEQARQHRHASCCESPGQDFTFPFGEGHIPPEKQVEVALEGGRLSALGQAKVVQHLIRVAGDLGDIYEAGSRAHKMYNLACHIDQGHFSREVKNADGTYTTRLKRTAYKEFSLKVEPQVLTQIGNIVSQHSSGGTYTVEVTRDLNKNPSEFGNGSSCWWTQYKASRCALKTNGGLALRSMRGTAVHGRVWVMPLKVGADQNLAPTFDTGTGIYFVFNGYGDLSEMVGPRVLAHMVGAEAVERIGVNVDRYYVNSNSGYLVGPQSVIDKHCRAGLTMTLPDHSDLYRKENKRVLVEPKLSKKEEVKVDVA